MEEQKSKIIENKIENKKEEKEKIVIKKSIPSKLKNFLIEKEDSFIIYIIVVVLIIIGLLNITLNNVSFTSKMKDIETEETFTSNIPEKSILILKNGIKMDETTSFQYLFSIFDLSEIEQKKSKTIFREGIKKYLGVYEIEGGLDTYLKIKSLIELYIKNINKKGSLYEANNLGVYSFYYNDEDKGTVYLLALIGGNVFGFEYNKKYHEEVKVFTKNIAKNILEYKNN